MKLNEGTTDPEEHVAQYRERMEINLIPQNLKEAYLCKGFGSTLTGAALKWLLSVPPFSIKSFAHLVNLFNNQWSFSRSFEGLTSKFYRVTLGCDEPLRDFVRKFNKEALDIPNMDVATAVKAFKMGLKKDTPFYEDLVMNPCRNLDEARNMALRFIKLEENRMIQQRLDGSSSNNHPNRKSDSPSSKPYRPKPYSMNNRVNMVDDDKDDESYPKLHDYCFSVDIPGLMCTMQDLGENARWPRENEKNGSWKDKSQWLAFHEDFGDMTGDCIALRKEISYLLSKGHLKELLGKKNQNWDPKQDPKVAKAEKLEGPTKTMTLPKEYGVTFNDEDRNTI
ncbi:uncharacterized protein LOC143575619 [Bidens hawaiensis]|uniref:uncharacterized protein LOC143575619 n=1 Tax=Bidens hawaiensis TaxID=980011 RepID=UPI00404B15BB